MTNFFDRLSHTAKAGLLALSVLALSPAVGRAQITLGVTFGTANDGLPCIGKGVCKETLTRDPDDPTKYVNAEAVKTHFQMSPDNKNVLMMSFLLSELKTKQPDQVSYFTDASGAYMFDANFTIAGTDLANVPGMPANAYISTTSNSTVAINGDIVTDYITLAITGN